MLKNRLRGPKNTEASRAYQGAVEAVMALILCLVIGYYADEYFESSPIGLILGAIIGFSSMVLRIIRMAPKEGSDNGPTEKP